MQTTDFPATTPAKTIYCPRSGVPLAKLTAVCSHGWPLLSSFQAALLHPIYELALDKLIIKLTKELSAAEALEWQVTASAKTELQITMSAILYNLDAIWQPPVEATHLWKQLEPSLPGWPVVIGSGARLAGLASWYHYATSKRMSFPQYRPSSKNKNLNWENFSAWLDDAHAIRKEWEQGRSKLSREDELRKRNEAILTVRADAVYKRIDFTKVWNWIDIQMAEDSRYPVGRRETFKTIFMRADASPEEWTLDDIEDLEMAVLDTCDLGNEISYFINNRLRSIKAIIQDFYSSFTLLSSVAGDGLEALDAVTPKEQAATKLFFDTFDRRASELDALPDAPKRDSFASFPKFLQAQAQWNILKRRYDMAKKPVATATAAVPAAAASSLPSQSPIEDAPF